MFWALVVTKILQLQGDKVPRTLCIHNFQAIISFLTSGTVDVSVCYCIIEGLGGGGGGGKVRKVQ